MRLFVFLIDFLIGLGALGSFAMGMGAYYKADNNTRTACIKVFATCTFLLIILAIVTAVLSIPIIGFEFQKETIITASD
jgi:hypothetical protein